MNVTYYYFVSYNYSYNGAQGVGWLEVPYTKKITTWEDIESVKTIIEKFIREDLDLTKKTAVKVIIQNYQLLRRERETKVKGDGNNPKQEILEGERNGKEV